MSLKDKLLKDIIEPAAYNRSSQFIAAKITKSDERANVCSVSFIDKEGRPVVKDHVQVRLYNQSIIDWFPKVDELVNIMDYGGYYEIVSKYSANYGATTKASTELKRDILSSICNNTGGSII